jgi:hypothetical protein
LIDGNADTAVVVFSTDQRREIHILSVRMKLDQECIESAVVQELWWILPRKVYRAARTRM